MKRTALFIFLVLSALQLVADNFQHVIILEHKGGHRDGVPMYFDMPAAYYEYNPKGQQIIIDGGGAVSYYDVEYEIEASGTVRFEDGFKVEKGATFKVFPACF